MKPWHTTSFPVPIIKPSSVIYTSDGAFLVFYDLSALVEGDEVELEAVGTILLNY